MAGKSLAPGMGQLAQHLLKYCVTPARCDSFSVRAMLGTTRKLTQSLGDPSLQGFGKCLYGILSLLKIKSVSCYDS